MANVGIYGQQGSTTTTRKAPGNSTPLKLVSANPSRQSITINNIGAVSVSMGQSATLTTSVGSDPLPATQQRVITGIAAQAVWYGLAASSTGDLSVIEEFAS